MRTCKDFLRELCGYLDDNLDPAMRRELEQHVNDCPNCWVVLDTTKKTIQVYKGTEPKAIPPKIHEKLMAALQKKMAAKRCGGAHEAPPQTNKSS